MTSKKAKQFYGAFGARLRRGPSALAFGHHQLLPVQLLPPGALPVFLRTAADRRAAGVAVASGGADGAWGGMRGTLAGCP